MHKMFFLNINTVVSIMLQITGTYFTKLMLFLSKQICDVDW